MAILEAINLKKSFNKIEVLKGISFTLEKGQVLSIIGSSGSGKTTLLRCLTFLERADSGIVKVNEKEIFNAESKVKQSASEQRANQLNFGLVFQNFNLFPQYSALENVTLAKKLLIKENPSYKKDRRMLLKQIDEEGKDLLDRVGLSDKRNNYPCELSGGQQQRVAIARALALHPNILCFDEPTSALDPELTGEVLAVMKDLASQNMTMIIVTHEMAFARDISTDIIFMDEGIIAEKGSPAELFGNPKNPRLKTFLSTY